MSVARAQEPDEMLTAQQAAAYCGMAYSSVRSAVWRGALVPDESRQASGGRQHLFRRETLDLWRSGSGSGPMDEGQAARYCRVDPSTIHTARSRGEIPAILGSRNDGRGVCYRFERSALDAWLRTRKAERSVERQARVAAWNRKSGRDPVKYAARLAERRARRVVQRQAAVVLETRCFNCRHCVQQPDERYDCAEGNWDGPFGIKESQRDHAGVRRIRRDFAELCEDFARREQPKDPKYVALGRLGGSKGGKAAAASRTPEERSEMAAHAANIRWGKAG